MEGAGRFMIFSVFKAFMNPKSSLSRIRKRPYFNMILEKKRYNKGPERKQQREHVEKYREHKQQSSRVTMLQIFFHIRKEFIYHYRHDSFFNFKRFCNRNSVFHNDTYPKKKV